MPVFYNHIKPELSTWALDQPLFYTASAPLVGAHVNISPKGLPSSTFTIFDPTHAAYIDATGSGAETISHVYENGRVTIMFCSFEKSPRIMRFFCKGKVVEWDSPEFEKTLERMGKTRIEGARAIIMLDVFKVQTSCGYGVPRLSTRDGKTADEEKRGAFEDRETLGHWASKKVEANELMTYQGEWNADSLDGLTGLRSARRERGERLWLTDAMATFRRIRSQKEAVIAGFLIAVFLNLLRLSVQYLIPPP